jgi:hypothetical protein
VFFLKLLVSLFLLLRAESDSLSRGLLKGLCPLVCSVADLLLERALFLV